MKSKTMSRFVQSSMVVVLLSLLVFSLWSTVYTQDVTHTAMQAVSVNNALQQSRYWSERQQSFVSLYQIEPIPDYRDMHMKAGLAFANSLQSLMEQGDVQLRALVKTMKERQEHYQIEAQALFIALDAHNLTTIATLGTATKLDSFVIINALESQLSIHQLQATTALDALTATQNVIRVTTMLVISLGFLALVGLFLVLHSYQRQAQTSWQRDLDHMERTALTDNLTGIGNHRAYQEAIAREMARSNAHGLSLSLALIDVDHFKEVNDTKGHAFGDQVLVRLGQILQRLLHGGQAYRLGGDEFAVILPHMTQDQVVMVFEGVRRAVQCELFGATISTGVAQFSLCESDADTLKAQADAALYEAKHQGRNAVVPFSAVKEQITILSAQSLHALQCILQEKRLDIVFQPIWIIEQQKLLAVEALSRPTPSSGFPGPQELFDIAERGGHQAELDRLCITSALHSAASLPVETLLFINICPQSLGTPMLCPNALLALVQEASIAPNRIVWEITERAIHRLDIVIAAVAHLRSMGFAFALDDTGSGNSGLELLTHIPLDYVKIDRGVIVRAMTDKTARGVLAGIMAIAHEIESCIIVEGIEDQEMLDTISKMIDLKKGKQYWAAQGYHLGRPSMDLAPVFPLANTDDEPSHNQAA